MAETVQALCERIQKGYDGFLKEAGLGLKGNKSAAKRARKISLELAKDFKEYRQLSLNGTE